MKRFKFLYLIPLAALIYSCEPEFKDEIIFEPGEADFRNYVAIGNSLTAGMQGNALSREGQINSYPAILAQQFAMVESGMATFKQPLLPEGPGVGATGNAKLVLGTPTDCRGVTSLGPVPAAAQGQIEQLTDPSKYIGSQWPFYNLGVPGAKVNDVIKSNYLNPFYARFADPAFPGRSIIESAKALNPTFYSLWIGNNDILAYATSGGEAGPITPTSNFIADLGTIISEMKSEQAEGVIANIPDITAIPFFNTIPYNALTLTAGQVDSLNAGYQNYNAGLDAAVPTFLTAEEAERRKVHFVVGANPFVIVDNSLTDLSVAGLPNYRHISSNEHVLLSIPMDSVKCGKFGSKYPISEQFVLAEDEIEEVNKAVAEYNAAIADIARLNGLAHVDAFSLINEFESGVSYDGVEYSTEFVTGGLFSLDGVHPNSRGYAIIANAHIDAINAKFNANIPKVNVNDYVGVTFPN